MRLVKITIILCFVLFAPSKSVSNISGDAEWEQSMLAGEAAYAQGRYAEAEKMFLAALEEAKRFEATDPKIR